MTGTRAPRRRPARRGGFAPRVAWALVALGGGLALWWWLRPEAPKAPPLDEIDEASRARLEEVLREAEREAADAP